MLDNLYRFSENAWHAKLFKWIFGVNASDTFRTMCPYFWTMVIVLLTLVLIVPFKLLFKNASKLLDDARTHAKRKKKKKLEAFVKKVEEMEINMDNCYTLTRTNCWDNFNSYISSELYDEIKSLAKNKQNNILAKKAMYTRKREQRIETIKENKILQALVFLISIVVILMLLVCIGYCTWYAATHIDWPRVGHISGMGVLIAIVGIIGYIALKSFYFYLHDKTECFQTLSNFFSKLKYIAYVVYPIVWIARAIIFIGKMLVATYKRYCPIITWESK